MSSKNSRLTMSTTVTTSHVWERCRLPRRGTETPCPFASGPEILRAVREQVPEIYRQHALDQYQHEFVPRMESIAAQFVQNAWLELGWNLRVGDRFTSEAHIQNLRVVEAHHRLARSQIHSLRDQGLLRQVAEETWEVVRVPRRVEMTQELAALAREYPRFAAEVELHQRTGPHLATILTGATDPLQLLFPGGSLELLERFYVEGSDLPAYHRLMQLAVSRAIASLPVRRALRVLEVGAGTGSFTRAVLPALPAEQTEYVFSDVGPAFLAAAKTQFAEYSGVDYRLFDLEKDPAPQGFAPGAFDLILATDVLHATCDLRQTLLNLRACLAPGGLLMFLEVLPRRHGWNSIFGLLKGWWHYTDTQLRTDSPLLDRTRWQSLLTDCGFENVASFGGYVNDSESEQAVFMAFAPAEANAPVVAESMASPAATGYVVFADRSGVADRLIALLRGPRKRGGACAAWNRVSADGPLRVHHCGGFGRRHATAAERGLGGGWRARGCGSLLEPGSSLIDGARHAATERSPADRRIERVVPGPGGVRAAAAGVVRHSQRPSRSGWGSRGRPGLVAAGGFAPCGQ